jgi:hypothetical protein
MAEFQYTRTPKGEIIDLLVPRTLPCGHTYQSVTHTAYRRADGQYSLHDIAKGGEPQIYATRGGVQRAMRRMAGVEA